MERECWFLCLNVFITIASSVLYLLVFVRCSVSLCLLLSLGCKGSGLSLGGPQGSVRPSTLCIEITSTKLNLFWKCVCKVSLL